MPSHDPCSASASPNTSTSSYLYTCNSTVKLASTAADLDCEKQNAAECIHSIVSLAQWLFPGPSVSYGDINAVGTHKEEFKTHTSPLPMVDLRPSQEYEQKCISNSSNGITASSHHCKRVVVNLPLESLLNGERSFELPPRNIPFAILVPSKYYTRNNSTLSIDFDQILFEFFYATKSKATKKSRIRWNIPQILLDDESLWADARRLGILLQNDGNVRDHVQIIAAGPDLYSNLRLHRCFLDDLDSLNCRSDGANFHLHVRSAEKNWNSTSQPMMAKTSWSKVTSLHPRR